MCNVQVAPTGVASVWLEWQTCVTLTANYKLA